MVIVGLEFDARQMACSPAAQLGIGLSSRANMTHYTVDVSAGCLDTKLHVIHTWY